MKTKMENAEIDRNIRIKQVMQIVGIGRATVWDWVKTRQDFPKPRKLSSRVTVWSEKEIRAFAEKTNLA
jgi:prophage regulatory protein